MSSNSLPENVLNYLKKFFSPLWKIEKEDEKLYENIVVIPSLAEYENLFLTLNSLEKNNTDFLDKTLVLVVINNSEKAEGYLLQNNFKTREFLENYSGSLNLNYVDAFSSKKAIPKKLAGVGFARKIGLDLALTKFEYNSSSRKLLIWLDADCEVEQNYLEVIVNNFNKNNLSSAVVEYEHKIDESKPESNAIVCYETFLRYFKLTLTYANSHYNYHAIGSTIVCDVESYIKAGGMNSKQAGEDFYFLEKLAKQNKIPTIKETTVYPSSRESWRVPFGTGQRVSRFLKNIQDEYLVYNPAIFDILKNWLEFFNSDSTISTEQILKETKKNNLHLYDFLVEQDFQKNWGKILNNSDSIDEIRKQKIYWFDAFRTLKLIHYLRDSAYPNVNVYHALQYLFEKIKIDYEFEPELIINDYKRQKEILIFLRNYLRKNICS